MIKNTNDGTTKPPYLRVDVNAGTWINLPEFSKGPRGTPEQILEKVKSAGFKGVQGMDAKLCAKFGLGSPSTGGRINEPGDADRLAREWKAGGYACATCHVAWGLEDDDVVDRLVHEIIDASVKHDIPIYIETHRATITQDMWRTVKLTERIPDIRFNGDFSHWYTGLEMVYGEIDRKLPFIGPVFDRVRFIHGRIGNPGSMQVDIGDGTNRPYVEHFKEMWTRAFAGFLKTAKPGDYIIFAPELLGPGAYYARLFKNANGELVEESDRWEQAIVYGKIAREAFAEAERRMSLKR
jgi:sugar phosphate isomerase/epimerase